jgi:hypothetical protein
MLSAWRRWRRPPTPSTEPESTEPETEDTEGEDQDESVFSGEMTPADTLSDTTGASTAETACEFSIAGRTGEDIADG